MKHHGLENVPVVFFLKRLPCLISKIKSVFEDEHIYARQSKKEKKSLSLERCQVTPRIQYGEGRQILQLKTRIRSVDTASPRAGASTKVHRVGGIG